MQLDCRSGPLFPRGHLCVQAVSFYCFPLVPSASPYSFFVSVPGRNRCECCKTVELIQVIRTAESIGGDVFLGIYFSFLIAFCSVFGQGRKDRKDLLSCYCLWGSVVFLQWLYNDFMLLANVDKLLCLLMAFDKAHQNSRGASVYSKNSKKLKQEEAARHQLNKSHEECPMLGKRLAHLPSWN